MKVYVIGTATYPAVAEERSRRLEEVAYHTSRAALEDAGVSRAQVDHVTLGACDELDGRPISSMLMAVPAGGFLTDEMKVTDSGLMALALGTARMMTGEFQLGLVASWCKSSKTDFDTVTRLRSDPFFTRPLGLNATTSDGLFAQAVGAAYGISEAEVAERVAAAQARALANPRGIARPASDAAAIAESDYLATPLREGHRAPMTDGAVTMVLASETFLRCNPHVRPLACLSGIGWSVDSYRLGNARLSEMASLKKAWAKALAMAGIVDSSALDVIELESPTGWHEAAAVRALGIADEKAISPSGGAFAQNPTFCTGLIGAVEAVLQVSGRAGLVQRPGARRAAAQSSHGFAQQGNVVACFEAVEELAA